MELGCAGRSRRKGHITCLGDCCGTISPPGEVGMLAACAWRKSLNLGACCCSGEAVTVLIVQRNKYRHVAWLKNSSKTEGGQSQRKDSIYFCISMVKNQKRI